MYFLMEHSEILAMLMFSLCPFVDWLQERIGGTCVQGLMWRGQDKLTDEQLSLNLLQERIGGVMRKIKCCKEFMGLRGRRRSS